MSTPPSQDVALTYDDILLEPQQSPVESRWDISTETQLTDSLSIDVPLASAPMDTITDSTVATKLSNAGAVGFLRRLDSIEDQIAEVEATDGLTIPTVGLLEDLSPAERLVEAGADAICLNIAHGHLDRNIRTAKILNEFLDVPLIAGNIATPQGAIDLAKAGADAVKVGVGPGSHCETRVVTGVGVPQFTAVRRVVEALNQSKAPKIYKTTVIADGGIQNSGDLAKAVLGAGADLGMIGGLIGKCKDAPAPTETIDGTTYNVTRGMASKEAREDLQNLKPGEQHAIEGSSAYTEIEYESVTDLVDSMRKGLQSSCSYMGGHTLTEARENAVWNRVTSNSIPRAGVHSTRKNL